MSWPIHICRTARNVKWRNQMLRSQRSADVFSICRRRLAWASGGATGIDRLFSVFTDAVDIVARRLAFQNVDVVVESLFKVFGAGRAAAGEIAGYESVADAYHVPVPEKQIEISAASERMNDHLVVDQVAAHAVVSEVVSHLSIEAGRGRIAGGAIGK